MTGEEESSQWGTYEDADRTKREKELSRKRVTKKI